MPTQSTNLSLKLFLESDVVDFEDINSNFEAIDAHIGFKDTTSGTSSYSGAASGTTTWKITKFYDNTVEMTTVLNLSTVACSTGSAMPYYSSSISLYFPVALTSFDFVSLNLQSEGTAGWISDDTAQTNVDHLTFRIASVSSESSAVFKRVFVKVKGVLQ